MEMEAPFDGLLMRLSMRNEIFAFTARKIQREPKKKEREGEGKR